MKMQKFKKKMIVFAVVFFLGFFVFGQVQGAPYVGDVEYYLIPNFDYTGYSCDIEKEFSLNVIDMDFSWDGTGIDFAVCFSPTGSSLDVPVQYHDFLIDPYPTFYDPIYKEMPHYMGSSSCGWCENYNNPEFGCEWTDISGHIRIDDWENAGLIIDDELVIDFYIGYSGHKLPQPINYFFCSEYVGSVLFNLNDGTFEPTEPTEPPEPDPINAECGSDAGKTFYGVSGPENFCEKGDFSWNDLDYNAETQTWTWICTGRHGGANTFCNAYWQAEAPPQVINAECGAFSYLESIDEADFFPNSPAGKCEKGIYRPDTFVSGSIGGSWVCSGVPYLIGESVRCSVRWSETLGDQIIPVPDIEYEDCDSYNIPEKWICQIRNFLAQAFLPSSEKLNSLNENIENIKNKAPFNYITAFTETLEAVQDDLSDEPIQMSLLGNQGTLILEGWQIPALFRKMFLVIFLIGFIVWAVNYIKRIF